MSVPRCMYSIRYSGWRATPDSGGVPVKVPRATPPLKLQLVDRGGLPEKVLFHLLPAPGHQGWGLVLVEKFDPV